ncbi:hypothetical protein R1flu_000817 [Riccia fluitans]|uniref:Uncharacterized protein n=1 Tax=Riccia fluitans TaxID=41844 RepID=A0ABD1Y4P0_9MARC
MEKEQIKIDWSTIKLSNNIQEISSKEWFEARLECWRWQIKFRAKLVGFEKPVFDPNEKNVSAHILAQKEEVKTKRLHPDTTHGGQKKHKVVFEEELELTPNNNILYEPSMPTGSSTFQPAQSAPSPAYNTRLYAQQHR